MGFRLLLPSDLTCGSSSQRALLCPVAFFSNKFRESANWGSIQEQCFDGNVSKRVWKFRIAETRYQNKLKKSISVMVKNAVVQPNNDKMGNLTCCSKTDSAKVVF